jgi:hypothetical protein
MMTGRTEGKKKNQRYGTDTRKKRAYTRTCTVTVRSPTHSPIHNFCVDRQNLLLHFCAHGECRCFESAKFLVWSSSIQIKLRSLGQRLNNLNDVCYLSGTSISWVGLHATFQRWHFGVISLRLLHWWPNPYYSLLIQIINIVKYYSKSDADATIGV